MQDILPELLRVKNVPPALYPVVTNGCFRLIRIFLACFSLASSENDVRLLPLVTISFGVRAYKKKNITANRWSVTLGNGV